MCACMPLTAPPPPPPLFSDHRRARVGRPHPISNARRLPMEGAPPEMAVHKIIGAIVVAPARNWMLQPKWPRFPSHLHQSPYKPIPGETKLDFLDQPASGALGRDAIAIENSDRVPVFFYRLVRGYTPSPPPSPPCPCRTAAEAKRSPLNPTPYPSRATPPHLQTTFGFPSFCRAGL
jgi:hypothetical protein